LRLNLTRAQCMPAEQKLVNKRHSRALKLNTFSGALYFVRCSVRSALRWGPRGERGVTRAEFLNARGLQRVILILLAYHMFRLANVMRSDRVPLLDAARRKHTLVERCSMSPCCELFSSMLLLTILSILAIMVLPKGANVDDTDPDSATRFHVLDAPVLKSLSFGGREHTGGLRKGQPHENPKIRTGAPRQSIAASAHWDQAQLSLPITQGHRTSAWRHDTSAWRHEHRPRARLPIPPCTSMQPHCGQGACTIATE
jgi:hypothetical protein